MVRPRAGSGSKDRQGPAASRAAERRSGEDAATNRRHRVARQGVHGSLSLRRLARGREPIGTEGAQERQAEQLLVDVAVRREQALDAPGAAGLLKARRHGLAHRRHHAAGGRHAQEDVDAGAQLEQGLADVEAQLADRTQRRQDLLRGVEQAARRVRPNRGEALLYGDGSAAERVVRCVAEASVERGAI